MFAYVDLERRVPEGHPLRRIRGLVNDALERISPEFDRLYATSGRPSVPPERLLRALLLQAFYSLRSERQLMERLEFDLLFRWFVGLGIDEPVWVASVYAKNRDRLLEGDVAHRFLAALLADPAVAKLLSHEHFSVDGTLIGAWASHKSFRPKDTPPPAEGGPDGNGWAEFKGERRTNETHASTTDPDARLYRKGAGQPALLCYQAHALMENRNGLIVDCVLTRATGVSERLAAVALVARRAPEATGRRRRITLGADRAYDTRDFVMECRELGVTPHVAQNLARAGGSAIDGRTTRHAGYRASQVARRRIEEAFAWTKGVAGQARTRLRGLERVGFGFALSIAAYDLARLSRLLAPPPSPVA